MASISQKKARRELEKESSRVQQEDIETLLQRQKQIEAKAERDGTLHRFSTDIRLMFALLRDYWNGRYRQIPWKSVAAIAGALLYVLNPLDLIPDIIIGFGLLDDAGVVALCLKLVETDLHRYAAWKELDSEAAARAGDPG